MTNSVRRVRPRIMLLTLIAALVAMGGAADASNCSTDAYDHNGSRMEFQICDGGVFTIVYTNPRSGLRPHGVRPGTLLINGHWASDRAITGTARIFNSRCGEITYPVAGGQQGTTITLTGNAPVRDRNCRIARYKHDVLVFTLIGGGGGPGGPGGPTPPPSAGDWHAIAGSFKSRGQAEQRARELGLNDWYVMNTNQCPNFRNGYWIATAGPFPKGRAQAFASSARHHGAYIKTCH